MLFSPGPVHFRAGWAGYRFDARYLDMALQRDERALRTMLQRARALLGRFVEAEAGQDAHGPRGCGVGLDVG